MNFFRRVLPAITITFLFFTNTVHSIQEYEDNLNMLDGDIFVWIMGPGSMSMKGTGIGLEAMVIPDNVEGIYNWDIIEGGNKAEITGQWGPFVWIEPREISDTVGDIIVELEFIPTDPPGDPVYDYAMLTVFDVEIVNGDSCLSETPVETEFFVGETKIYKAKVKPDDFEPDIWNWIYPWSEWTIFEPDREYCYVTGILPDWGMVEVHVFMMVARSQVLMGYNLVFTQAMFK